jgi:hypothetical protein
MKQNIAIYSNVSKKNGVRCFLSALYLSVVWLASQITIQGFEFDRIPFYLIFTVGMFFVLEFEAISYAVFMFLFLGAYELLKGVQPEFSYSLRGFLGILALSCILSTCWFSLKAIHSYSYEQIGKWLRMVLLTILLSILIDTVLGYFGITETAYTNEFFLIPVYSGLSSEPSFLALVMAPYIFILCCDFSMFKKYIGRFSIFMMAAIVLLCPSATLFAECATAGAITIIAHRVKSKGTFLIGIGLASLVVILGWAIMSNPYFADRVFGVLSSDNMLLVDNSQFSALAFNKGREMAEYSILHFPFGVDFLDMRVLAPKVSISFLSDWSYLYDFSSKDGASILFKGICELGILFIVFVFAAILRFFREVFASHSGSFFGVVVIGFEFSFFCNFFRGASYFTGAIAIGVSALVFGLLHSQPQQNKAFIAPQNGSMT